MTSARIVVSLVPRDMDALERALAARAHRGADLVEIRLDAIADEVADGAERFARLLAGFGRPVIAALHGDGADSDDDDAAREDEAPSAGV